MLFKKFLRIKAVTSHLAVSAFLAMTALGGVGANAQTGIFYTPAQQSAMAQSNGQSNRMTQADVDAMSDQTAKQSAQWSVNKAKEWQTQADGLERRTDLNAQGKERLFFTPHKLTAADCLVGRHWELIPPAGIAGCVCDGDTTHKAVSNDAPAACGAPPPPSVTVSLACSGTTLMNMFSNGTQTVNTYNSVICGYIEPPGPPPAPVLTYVYEDQTLPCPPPSVGSGTLQTRQVTYTNGVATRYGPWVSGPTNCTTPPPIVILPPPPLVCITSAACEGVNLVTRNSCDWPTLLAVVWSAPSCGAPPPPGPVITFGSENQTLACPALTTGTGTVQSRSVTYTNGVPTAYGSWTTVRTDCTPTPPEPQQPPPPVYITIYFASSCSADITSALIDPATLGSYPVNLNGPYSTYAEAFFNSGWGACGL